MAGEFKRLGEIEDAFEGSLLPVLFQGRRALLANPPPGFDRGIIDSGMCRAAAIAVVAAIDALLAEWKRAAPRVGEYISTFVERDGKTAVEKASALGRAFQEFHAPLDENVVLDYAALRDLRHLIVHVPPDDERRAAVQKLAVADRGFPADTSNPWAFDGSHWDRIWRIYWSMRHGIYAIGLFGSADNPFAREFAQTYAEADPPSEFASD